MRYPLIVAVLAIQLCALLLAQPDAAAQLEARQFVTDLVNASLKPSLSELDKFYADEFVATNAQGAILNKSAVIAALTSGRLKFKSYELETRRSPNPWERRRHSRHREDREQCRGRPVPTSASRRKTRQALAVGRHPNDARPTSKRRSEHMEPSRFGACDALNWRIMMPARG